MRHIGSISLSVLVLSLAACTNKDEPTSATPASAQPSSAGSTTSAPAVPSGSPSATPSASSSTTQTPTSGTADCSGQPIKGSASTAADPSSATYLGTGKDDAANAIDIGAGCTVVIGGAFTGDLLAKATSLAGASAKQTGAVLRLDSTGRKLLSAARVGGTVNDLEVGRTSGDIAVATDAGVRVLDPTAASVRWLTSAAASRVAIGDNGTVAALTGTTVTVYDSTGKVTGTVKLDGKTVNDVAVDDRTGKVFVTGFTQYGGPCQQVQIPFVHAYNSAGAQQWKLYDFGPNDLGDLCADSRGDRVSIGRDGKLYFAGEMAGGNTVFNKDGKSTTKDGPNVGYDKFTQTYNTKSSHLTYIARLDSATGAVVAGQSLITRIDVKGDQGNTIKPLAITADAQGRIYAGGVAAYQIADRPKDTLNGHTLKAYAGGDAWLLITSPDLTTRLLWTAFNDGGTGEIRGVTTSGAIAAVAGRADSAPLYTNQPVQTSAAPTAGAGYAAVLPARQ